jgi:hypothetical protein
MKQFALIGVCVAVLAVGFTGCNWETGNDATSWSSSYNWVNFSGTYRSAAGGLLVTDYTTTPSTPGSTNTLSVQNESQPSFIAAQTVFQGKLKNGNIVAGSVGITLANTEGVAWQTLSDNGNRVLTGSQGSGTISYESGTWTFTLNAGIVGPVFNGISRANYSYQVSNSGSSGSGARPGSTGSIYSFIINHQGQHLTFTDNNGATYTGKIGEIRSTSGAQNTDIGQVGADEEGNDSAKYTYYESPLPEDGDTVNATFECSGVSAALMRVRIVGNLQGTVAAGVFTGRTLSGTWIELGGKTGDINGQTTSIPVVDTAAEVAVEETAETVPVE